MLRFAPPLALLLRLLASSAALAQPTCRIEIPVTRSANWRVVVESPTEGTNCSATIEAVYPDVLAERFPGSGASYTFEGDGINKTVYATSLISTPPSCRTSWRSYPSRATRAEALPGSPPGPRGDTRALAGATAASASFSPWAAGAHLPGASTPSGRPASGAA